jgi:hypothetical protein
MTAEEIAARRFPSWDDSLFDFSPEQENHLANLIGGDAPSELHFRFISRIRFLIHGFRKINRRDSRPHSADVRKELREFAEQARKLAALINDSQISREAFDLAGPKLFEVLFHRLKVEDAEIQKAVYPPPLHGFQYSLQNALLEIAATIEGVAIPDKIEAVGGRPRETTREAFLNYLVKEYQRTFGDFPTIYRKGSLNEFFQVCLQCAEFAPGNVHQLLIDTCNRLSPTTGTETPEK